VPNPKSLFLSGNAKKGRSAKRIGLFGGTFNPIHLGHLRGVEEIRESFDLEEVIFIPSAIPPHKEMGEVVEACHRLEMVRRATASNSHFRVVDIELKRPGKSYSIETIRYFQERHPEGLYFILGRDAFVEIETWKDFHQLFSLSNFIVMTRPRLQRTSSTFQLPGAVVSFFQYDRKRKGWVHPSGHTLHVKEISYLDISSTKVRELIERRESVRYLIPSEVEAYIQHHRLYQKSG
jgi:nicotinate-nucleotide adenylyltransferase